MDIRVLRPGDDGLVAAASHLFDGPARPEATARFLAEDGHHLLVAYEGEQAVGFVSGVEITHPDKGTEMFLYELAVDEPFRRQGIGRALVDRLTALARDAGCYGMWVVTDDDNEAARATYEGTGAVPETGQVVEVWTYSPPARTPPAVAARLRAWSSGETLLSPEAGERVVVVGRHLGVAGRAVEP